MTFRDQCVLVKQMSSIMAQPLGPAFPCLLGHCTQTANPLLSPASFSMWRSFSVACPCPWDHLLLWVWPEVPPSQELSASVTWDDTIMRWALLPSMQVYPLHGAGPSEGAVFYFCDGSLLLQIRGKWSSERLTAGAVGARPCTNFIACSE